MISALFSTDRRSSCAATGSDEQGAASHNMDGPRRSSLFTNPLAGVVLGDPFVLRHRGRFYLYGTHDGPPPPDGRTIPVFRSDNLTDWEPLGGALEPREPSAE